MVICDENSLNNDMATSTGKKAPKINIKKLLQLFNSMRNTLLVIIFRKLLPSKYCSDNVHCIVTNINFLFSLK